MTRDEEKEFGMRVQKYGDREAADALVTSNLRLVVKIALEFQRVWMQNLLDLIQEGNIGLMQAVRKFDPYKNVRFSDDASFRIKSYILKNSSWTIGASLKWGPLKASASFSSNSKRKSRDSSTRGSIPKPKLLF
ncbi:MAG: sigma factor [Deltaproteobacteria bacterium]|nr:sigma factor [Deltaproteobacteria bacterium]